MQTTDQVPSLPEVLAQNMDSIIQALVDRLKESGGPAYTSLPLEMLGTRVQRLVDVFWQSIAQNDSAILTNYISSVTRERSSQGYSIRQVQRVAIILRDVLLKVVDTVYADDPALRLKNSRRIEELILSGFGAGAFGVENGREAIISRQNQALRRTSDKDPG